MPKKVTVESCVAVLVAIADIIATETVALPVLVLDTNYAPVPLLAIAE